MDCPVCANPVGSEPVAKYSANRVADHFCNPARDPERNAKLLTVIERLWGGRTCSVLHCRLCDFMFGVPYIAGDEDFYAILHEQRGYPGWRYEYDIALRYAANVDGVNIAAALDIGAGNGVFLKSLPDSWHRVAVEGSPLTRAALRENRIEAYSSVHQISEDGAFHLITLFQVLEHLAPFDHCLRECRRLIHPEGLLVISVPDAHAMVLQERTTGCPDYPPNHVNKWTPKSLTHALRTTGFTVRETMHERPSLRTLRGALHLRLLTDAAQPGSLASHIYSLKSRKVRAAMLAALTPFAALRMAPHWTYFLQGGSFTMVAAPYQPPFCAQK